jgi:anthranilate phosphoribosyltransferase
VTAADPDRSAEIARAVMSGATGAERALTVANAGAAIYVGGGADGIEAGVRAAEEAIDSGAARAAMERFVERTRQLAAA